MDNRYGFSHIDWNSAKQEMREILIERARARGTISYSELVAGVKSITLEPHSHSLDAILGEISSEEDNNGRGMLTVIVVHKSGDMQPGPGFFELAKELGHDTSDITKCWIDEVNRVHAQWSQQ